MKALPKGAHIAVAVLLAGICGLFAYFPWVILESLDFMSPPRRVANIGSLLVIFVPLVLVFGMAWWKIAKPNSYFFESLGMSALLTFLIMVAIHQSSVHAKWQQTSEGQFEVRVAKFAAARERVMPNGKIGNLNSPLGRDEISVLAGAVPWPNIDGATLHRVFVSVPKQLDCDIAKNPNVFQQDLLSIWNEHACPDSYFTANPQTPLDVVKVIFDSHHDTEADEKTRMARNQAADRLAKESCDAELLYSLFNAKGDLALNTMAGSDMRAQMVSNVCTPWVVRKQMQKLPNLKQPPDYERAYPPMSREVWEAQHWFPSR
jgi:hypothetical protein